MPDDTPMLDTEFDSFDTLGELHGLRSRPLERGSRLSGPRRSSLGQPGNAR